MPRRAQPRYDKSRDQWRLFHEGHQHYLCSGRANEGVAWQVAEKIRGTPLVDGAIPLTVTQAADAWLRQRGTPWHEWLLAPFMQFGRGQRLVTVHAAYLDDYMLHLERTGYTRKGARSERRLYAYSPSTIRRQLSLARRVLHWAHVRRYMECPVPTLPRLPAIPELDRALRIDQVRAIFEHLPHPADDLLRFMALTGARPGEVCGLKHEERRGHIFELHRGKTWRTTGRPRVIIMPADAVAIVERQPRRAGGDAVFVNSRGRPYQPSGLRSIIRRAGVKAGVALSGSYVLRHSFAQAALDSGVLNLDEVAEAIGHVPGSRATRIYARVRQQKVLTKLLDHDGLVSPDRVPAARDRSDPAGQQPRKGDRWSRNKTAKARSRRQAG